MNWPWKKPLTEIQTPNPVVYTEKIDLPKGFIYPTDEMLNQIFTGKGHQLKTWGRKPKVKLDDPHWIGVKGSTPLHTDPAYPRYTHQLKIRVDGGIVCRGLNKVEQPLFRGLFYILDTHSPHQVLAPEKDLGWNVSISLDSNNYYHPKQVIPVLLKYGATQDFLKL